MKNICFSDTERQDLLTELGRLAARSQSSMLAQATAETQAHSRQRKAPARELLILSETMWVSVGSCKFWAYLGALKTEHQDQEEDQSKA